MNLVGKPCRVALTLLAVTILGLILSSPKVFSRETLVIHHGLRVTLDPENRGFQVDDTITLPETSPRSLLFTLRSGLAPVSLTPGVTLSRESTWRGPVPLEQYRVTLPPRTHTFALKFGGELYHPLSPSGEETLRGAKDTPGLISQEGVFLSGASHWYPQFDEGFVTFNLEITLPQEWEAISQGDRVAHEVHGSSNRVQWRSSLPQQEIYVIAGKFFEYARSEGNAETMVFLREQDSELAERYLHATSRYLDMYSKLIGQYPYGKFALVENFWETGYGMPSFTLMGPKVIRFPFILDSSYPHEILHNWWGNSVYPDPKSGNWSEGLTAYLADHLIREQRGDAIQYRRDTLQKYADYVSRDTDFPLAQFRFRHSSTTEAVGYGKALMFFHMLRIQMGDGEFLAALRDFYAKNRFRLASFDDIRKSVETISGRNMKLEFAQWVDRPGAPQLRIDNVTVRTTGDNYRLAVTIVQVQPGPPFRLSVPVAITLEHKADAFQATILMTGKRHKAELILPSRPLRIDVDPEFDVFRRLAPEEIPPALTQVFGSEKLTIVIPSSCGEALINQFRELARAWTRGGSASVRIMNDSELATLPSDSSVVVLGWDSRFQSEILSLLRTYRVESHVDSVTILKAGFPKSQSSFVFTVRNPKNPDVALTWIATDLVEAVPALTRKLPHYHNYSYLVFEGAGAKNVAKGHWPLSRSPLSRLAPREDGTIGEVDMGRLKDRKPLTSVE